jgi:Protein of unknown function (DUF2442)
MSIAESEEREVPQRITKVEARDGNTLVFVIDGVHRRANLTGLIAKSKHFGRFADDKAAFKRVRPTKWSYGIEWENGLDLSGDTLIAMSEEQKEMTGKEFEKCLARLKLNIPEAAQILDTTERTVRNYLAHHVVPRTCAVTIRRCLDDNTFFAALYRPIPVAPRGRPKAVPR